MIKMFQDFILPVIQDAQVEQKKVFCLFCKKVVNCDQEFTVNPVIWSAAKQWVAPSGGVTLTWCVFMQFCGGWFDP